MKKILFIFIIIFLAVSKFAFADIDFAEKLKGKILLQVQQNGEAWYVNPSDQKRYYLGRPDDAFDLMRNLGIGITDNNLKKFPIGILNYDDHDDDHDGFSNRLEAAIGTDPANSDSDDDGYDDKNEIINNYNPTGTGTMPIDNNFVENNTGKIFLQVEKSGEAWYINPSDLKKYYLGKPADAFTIMKSFSLGITNQNLFKINAGYIFTPIVPSPEPNPLPNPNPSPEPKIFPATAEEAISGAANAIRSGSISQALRCFIPEIEKAVTNAINSTDAANRLFFGNMLSGSTLISSSENEAVYSAKIEFYNWKVDHDIHVKKQADGSWKLISI